MGTQEGGIQWNRINWRTLCHDRIVFLGVSQVPSSWKIARKDSFIEDVWYELIYYRSHPLEEDLDGKWTQESWYGWYRYFEACAYPDIMHHFRNSILKFTSTFNTDGSRGPTSDEWTRPYLHLASHRWRLARLDYSNYSVTYLRSWSSTWYAYAQVRALKALAPRCVHAVIPSLPTYSCTSGPLASTICLNMPSPAR